ncbi:MAG: hypothetical protein V1837_03620 [Candidatus Woesearchaeota archaeon]
MPYKKGHHIQRPRHLREKQSPPEAILLGEKKLTLPSSRLRSTPEEYFRRLGRQHGPQNIVLNSIVTDYLPLQKTLAANLGRVKTLNLENIFKTLNQAFADALDHSLELKLLVQPTATYTGRTVPDCSYYQFGLFLRKDHANNYFVQPTIEAKDVVQNLWRIGERWQDELKEFSGY